MTRLDLLLLQGKAYLLIYCVLPLGASAHRTATC